MWAHLQLTGAPLAAATTAVARPLRGDETAQPVNLLRQAGVQLLGGVGDGQCGEGQDAHAPPPPLGAKANLVVAQQLLALLLAAPQRVLTLLGLPRQGPDLQALLGVLL